MIGACLPLLVHFFESFPNGWDQAEYAWCVDQSYLPHSPYVLFVLLGELLHALLPAAAALSTVSLVAGLFAIVCLGMLAGPGTSGWTAALLFGSSTAFVRQATTQEVYALQVALLLGSAALLAGRRVAAGGIVYGCAFAAHNASAFVAPALLWGLVRGRESAPGGTARAVGIWLGAAATVVAGVYGFVALVLPAEPGARLPELVRYLRGMPPGLSWESLVQPAFLAESVAAMGHRLTASGIEVTRGPLATGPVGLSWLHGAVALAGAVAMARSRPRCAVFWLLWLAPFAVYEIGLGWNLDYGVYLVFVLPPVCVVCGQALRELARWRGRLGALAALGLLFALLATPARQLALHWDDPALDRQRHDSPATLAALWARDALPPDAVVIQPRAEWNANLLPLLSGRRHVARQGASLRLFHPRGPHTPMKPEAYELLTTDALRDLLRAGRPVFAFEPDPLGGANVGRLDPAAFEWREVARLDLAAEAARHGLSGETRARHAGHHVVVYRAERAERNR